MVTTLSYQLFKKIRAELIGQFPLEADTFAFSIIEHFSGFTQTDIIIDKKFATGPQFENQITSIINRLRANEPIQYVLGKAYFYERPFEVNKATLIPRQETEELVHLILIDIKNEQNLSILDIGTGTGCIPISLQLESKSHNLQGIDICKHALETAKRNALALEAKVGFKVLDILKENLSATYDVIISNPPYVLNSEKSLIKPNVLDYEPNSALFVSDKKPLLFYKRITELAAKKLNSKGRLYFEINEKFGKEVVELLKSYAFTNVLLHQDLNGKDRFVSGVLLN